MIPSVDTPALSPDSVVRSLRKDGPGLAEISLVPPDEARRILHPVNRWIAAGLTVSPILVAVVCGLFGLVMAAKWNEKWPIGSGILAVASLLTVVACVFWLVALQQFLATRYLRWVGRRVVERRVAPLVRPLDPRAEFVDLVSRSHWEQNMLEAQTDSGFFMIDAARRELLYEGDFKRYRIPFEAVSGCRVEEFCMGGSEWRADVYFMIVLEVDTKTGPREIPFAMRHLKFGIRRARRRRQEAQEFCEGIVEALQV